MWLPLFSPFRFIAPQTLSYLTFQSFDFERTTFDIYMFIHGENFHQYQQSEQLPLNTNH